MASDPTITDDKRTGQDLLERIAELEAKGSGDGWRYLLKACGNELTVLSHQLEMAQYEQEILLSKFSDTIDSISNN